MDILNNMPTGHYELPPLSAFVVTEIVYEDFLPDYIFEVFDDRYTEFPMGEFPT